MNLMKSGLSLAIIASAMLWSGAGANASQITDLYMEALEKNDQAALAGIVKYKKDAIPAEVQSLIDRAKAPEATAQEKEHLFYVAELMARSYKDLTGDVAPLLEVKKRAFDSRLSAPVTSEPANGAHIVDLPKASAEVKNIFKPDNIVIKQGETVRWVNSDEIAHVFSTMSAISAGRFSASSIPPGESWEFKFDKPGEYFYLCFIHQSMIGKVTVEGAKAETEATPAAPTAPAVSAAPAPPAAAPPAATGEEDVHHGHGAPAPPEALRAE